LSKKNRQSGISNSSIILLSWLITLSVSAEIYKWVDEEGNVHYGEKPPSTITEDGIKTIKYKDNVDTHSANEALKKKSKSLNKLSKKRKEKREDVATKKEKLAKNKVLCEQAKKNLANYQFPKVSMKEDDGSVRALGEEERQLGIKKSEEIVKQVCN
jgi:hypothetical protein